VLYAFVSSSPLYENLSTSLSSGEQAANVAALQRALKAKGYYTGSITGQFDYYTEVALEEWQGAQGLSETGTLDTSEFLWVPKGAVISDWQVGIGSAVGSGTVLATLYYPGQLEAQAQVGQADISLLKTGQAVQLTIDGHSGTIDGTISSISQQPSSSSSAAGASSSTVDYTVMVKLKSVPSYAKEGMTGSLAVTIEQHSNVLVVPTSAITGDSSTSYVRVLMNGQPVLRQVQTGMATASLTEITAGLAEGETVITGTISSSTGTTSSGGSLLNGGGAFPEGGYFRRLNNGAQVTTPGGGGQ
jgi:peptidoglycan hydrolase-like protein with peptidoglycan-binding domain